MVLFDWLRPDGVRPRPFVIAGLAVGFMGVALLARGHGNHPGPAYGWGIAALMAASMSWAFGSIFNRQARKPASPLLGVAMQMIAGGTLLLGLAAVRGEAAQFSFGRVTLLSAGAWLYLTALGSLVGYTCYVWLLHASTPARVATYAYVNPFIAVLLGCTIGHESFSHELFVAGVLIIAAVVLIVRGGAAKAEPATQYEEAVKNSVWRWRQQGRRLVPTEGYHAVGHEKVRLAVPAMFQAGIQPRMAGSECGFGNNTAKGKVNPCNPPQSWRGNRLRLLPFPDDCQVSAWLTCR